MRPPPIATKLGRALSKMAAALRPKPKPKLRVLCFGDSLTAGYSAMGAIHHPYNEKLEQMLAMAFPDLDIETAEDGESGATVMYGFLNRMQNQCGWSLHNLFGLSFLFIFHGWRGLERVIIDALTDTDDAISSRP